MSEAERRRGLKPSFFIGSIFNFVEIMNEALACFATRTQAFPEYDARVCLVKKFTGSVGKLCEKFHK